MSPLSRTLVLTSLITLAVVPSALALNVVNASSSTVACILGTSCTLYVTDNGASFSVPGGSGSATLQSRIAQTNDGRWLYMYRVNLTPVAGLTYIPYASYFAILNVGTIRQYDYNVDGISTDDVFNLSSGAIGTKPVTSAFPVSGYTYFQFSNPVYAGSYPGGGESSYFFGFVSSQAPVLRTVWVYLDSGWVSMQGYAPPL